MSDLSNDEIIELRAALEAPKAGISRLSIGCNTLYTQEDGEIKSRVFAVNGRKIRVAYSKERDMIYYRILAQ